MLLSVPRHNNTYHRPLVTINKVWFLKYLQRDWHKHQRRGGALAAVETHTPHHWREPGGPRQKPPSRCPTQTFCGPTPLTTHTALCKLSLVLQEERLLYHAETQWRPGSGSLVGVLPRKSYRQAQASQRRQWWSMNVHVRAHTHSHILSLTHTLCHSLTYDPQHPSSQRSTWNVNWTPSHCPSDPCFPLLHCSNLETSNTTRTQKHTTDTCLRLCFFKKRSSLPNPSLKTDSSVRTMNCNETMKQEAKLLVASYLWT